MSACGKSSWGNLCCARCSLSNASDQKHIVFSLQESRGHLLAIGMSRHASARQGRMIERGKSHQYATIEPSTLPVDRVPRPLLLREAFVQAAQVQVVW